MEIRTLLITSDSPTQLNVTITDWAPVYYQLVLPSDNHAISIHISGDNDTLAVVSVQNFTCPVVLSPYALPSGS